MKFFKLIKKNFAMLGISTYSSNQPYCISRKTLIAFISYATNNILNYSFIFRGGHSFVEYTDIMCMSATTTMIAIFYTIVFIKTEKFLEFIDSCRKIATKRE